MDRRHGPIALLLPQSVAVFFLHFVAEHSEKHCEAAVETVTDAGKRTAAE